MAQTQYGDISPRTAAYAASEMLKRGIPFLNLEKFGQVFVIPNNKTKSAIFRRYNSLPFTPNALTEGVTPPAKQLTKTDVTANLVQYGDRMETSDVVMDTHEDPVLSQMTEILGEQAANMIETVRWNVVKAGTNVLYSGSATSRGTVVAAVSDAFVGNAVRALKRQNARKVTKVIRSTPNYGTVGVNASFACLCHPDLERDIRGLTGFRDVVDYGQVTPWENEIGKVAEVRFITSTIYAPFADAGGAKGSMLSTSGTSADVYPLLFLGVDAYGIVPLKGGSSLTPMVVNPKPSDSDPMGQRGHVAWKSMQTAVILNDMWMIRGEAAATA
jgi:N4-gp56 family major capsid protein